MRNKRGLAATGRAEKHAELVLADLEIDIANDGRTVTVRFLDAS